MKLSLIAILTIATGLASAGVIDPLEVSKLLARDCPDQDCTSCEQEAAQTGQCVETLCCGCALC
jgi:hypothetical protein